MTWLPDVPEGGTDWERLAAVSPDGMGALAGLVGVAQQYVDPRLLELVRLRVATLLGNRAEPARQATVDLPSGQRAALPHWPTSPLFSESERACLELAEQFVMSAGGVTDGQVAAVAAHLGTAGCYAFVEAVSVLETFQRACLTLGVDSFPEVVR